VTPSILALRAGWARRTFAWRTRRYLPLLYRAARALTGEDGEAEDLVHDTYLAAFRAYPKLESQTLAAMRPWLLRMLTNCYRDAYRRRVRAPDLHLIVRQDGRGDVVELAAGAAPAPPPERRHKRFLDAVDEALAALSPEVRLVVVLGFVESLSQREIAAVAQCPVGTVAARLSRGRQILKAYLRDHVDLPLRGVPRTPGGLSESDGRPA
jgi:RNA polymerase sigma-70 factor (ECF subfamily)